MKTNNFFAYIANWNFGLFFLLMAILATIAVVVVSTKPSASSVARVSVQSPTSVDTFLDKGNSTHIRWAALQETCARLRDGEEVFEQRRNNRLMLETCIQQGVAKRKPNKQII